MLIGILSDSHGRHLRVRRAVELFDRLGVEHVIHCGDVGGTEVLDELIGRACTIVWGNTDPFHDRGMFAYMETIGIRPPERIPTRVTLGGRKLAIYHGHEPNFHNAPHILDVDYILHGHSHVARNERIGRVRVINPGALHRARIHTVATLETGNDEVAFHEIE